MSNHTSMLHIRVDDDTKEQATAALDAMGLSVSDAVRIFLKRVVADQAFPLELKVPNTETRAAMNAIRERLEKLREDAYEVRDAGMEDVRRRIEDNPIASVLIAFCLGGIFSWMLRR